MKLTREELNQVKKLEAEEKYKSFAPDEIECIWFSICCEIGTVSGCKDCEKKRKRQ